ncbi:MAG: FtsZ-localized protein A [Holosporales bacterium]
MRILYHYPLCPFSRKVRFLMHEKKLDVSFEVENTWDNRPKLLKMNAAGTLPIFVDINGRVISDDTSIVEYLEEVYPQTKFLGADPYQRAEIRRLVSWFDKKFYHEVSYPLFMERILKRFDKNGQYGGPNSSLLRQSKQNILFHLDYISWLADRRNWLGGDFFSLADMAAAAHLSMADYFGDVPFDKYPIAKDWYMRLKSRPTFRSFLSDKLPGITPYENYTLLDF